MAQLGFADMATENYAPPPAPARNTRLDVIEAG
jgi:hypothetical protein